MARPFAAREPEASHYDSHLLLDRTRALLEAVEADLAQRPTSDSSWENPAQHGAAVDSLMEDDHERHVADDQVEDIVALDESLDQFFAGMDEDLFAIG